LQFDIGKRQGVVDRVHQEQQRKEDKVGVKGTVCVEDVFERRLCRDHIEGLNKENIWKSNEF
jgi:hypothetical protein